MLASTLINHCGILLVVAGRTAVAGTVIRMCQMGRATMFCPHCKETNPVDAKFCGACGKKMMAEAEEGSLDSFAKWVVIIAVGIFILIVLGA